MVREITPARCQHWVDGLIAAQHRPASITLWTHILSAVLEDAVRLGVIPSNPAAKVRRPTAPRVTKPTWSLAEVQRVMATLGGDTRYRAVYTVALSTGMRPGEIRALSWDDVDLVAGEILVQRTVTRDTKGKEIIGGRTKTGHNRALPITDAARVALIAWRRELNLERLAAPAWEDGNLVFPGWKGALEHPKAWHTRHRELIAEAGVTPITLHQLRHTHATLAMRAGTHPRIVAEELGHSSIQTTLDQYSHVSSDLLAAASESLSGTMFMPDDTTTSNEKLPRPGGDSRSNSRRISRIPRRIRKNG